MTACLCFVACQSSSSFICTPSVCTYQVGSMILRCALSKKIPEEPVVSPVSGCIFEKRQIIKHIQQHGTDPINGKELNEDMLIEVKTAPVVNLLSESATSISALLKSMQDIQNSAKKHAFTLRQQVQMVCQAEARLQCECDASLRVVDQLINELTAAGEALEALKPQAAAVEHKTMFSAYDILQESRSS